MTLLATLARFLTFKAETRFKLTQLQDCVCRMTNSKASEKGSASGRKNQ
jgi:hypothetical protein